MKAPALKEVKTGTAHSKRFKREAVVRAEVHSALLSEVTSETKRPVCAVSDCSVFSAY
jgi:hypothetical protein